MAYVSASLNIEVLQVNIVKLCLSEVLPKEWDLLAGRVDEGGGTDVQVLHVHQEILRVRCRLNNQESRRGVHIRSSFYLRI
jgi:hypothetical protein